jgi:hypothetical protein
MEDMNATNRAELAAFLRARRARLSPRQAGLPEAGGPGRRRTPGLRRQEVAQLAGMSVMWTDEHFVRFTRATVADLRAAYARYPGDPAIDQLVTEMLALSPPFAQMWAEHEVEVRGPMLKHIDHPQAGPLEFECQVLHITDAGQRLIAYCAAPGSAAEAAFRAMAEPSARPR